jgi:hypothetical protein
MISQERIQEIEQAFGFKYPMSFVSMLEELSALLGTDKFRRAFSETRLILSAAEIAGARASTPTALLPFMLEEQRSWQDIYAFDLDSGGPEFRVAVWADHAIVMAWESFPVFFEWIRERVAKYDSNTLP